MQLASPSLDVPSSTKRPSTASTLRLTPAAPARKTPPTSAQVLENFKRATALFFRRRLQEPRPAAAPGSDAGPWVSSCTMQAWEQALGKKPLKGASGGVSGQD